jgi:prevent-host-death family protein
MKIASVANIKAHFSAFVKESAEGPVVVTRNGKPVAVLVAVGDDDELEDLVLTHSRRFRAILAKSRDQIRTGHRLTHDEFWAATPKSTKAQTAPKPARRARPRQPIG